jgi:hypothetical protein
MEEVEKRIANQDAVDESAFTHSSGHEITFHCYDVANMRSSAYLHRLVARNHEGAFRYMLSRSRSIVRCTFGVSIVFGPEWK